jgi:hypothetical protein
VIVTRSSVPETTGGTATLKAPVPLGPVSMRATSKFCIMGPTLVLMVAVSSRTGVAGMSVEALGPVWAENTMLAPGGIWACQSNSVHLGSVWGGHELAVKSTVKVAGGYPVMATGGGGGCALSGDTHEVRSKNMNSSAFSCDDSVPWRHDSGNSPELNGVHWP